MGNNPRRVAFLLFTPNNQADDRVVVVDWEIAHLLTSTTTVFCKKMVGQSWEKIPKERRKETQITNHFKVLVIGDTSTGKSAFIER